MVTVTPRGPPVAPLSIANVAVTRVEDTNATLLTVIPAPALTVAPLTNPLPSIVTGTVAPVDPWLGLTARSEEHTSELQSLAYLVCRLLLEKKKKQTLVIT